MNGIGRYGFIHEVVAKDGPVNGIGGYGLFIDEVIAEAGPVNGIGGYGGIGLFADEFVAKDGPVNDEKGYGFIDEVVVETGPAGLDPSSPDNGSGAYVFIDVEFSVAVTEVLLIV